jgi:hypothetical protein
VLTLLAFLTTSCVPCRPFWEALADPATRAALAVGVGVVAITPSRSTEDERLVARLAGPGLPVQMSSATWFSYGVLQAGTFLLVSHPAREQPWEHPAEVLGAATPATPAELATAIARWLNQAP